MTQHHLSPDEFVDAAAGALAEGRRRHVEGCDDCREHLAAMRQLANDVDLATVVPEPSPLFWDQFSRRVRVATALDSPAAAAWWSGWRPFSLGAMLSAAVLLIALAVRQPSPGDAGDQGAPLATALGAPGAAGEVVSVDDGSWDLMVMMASDLSTDELHHLAAPMTGVADTMGTDLTLAQQQELVRLIRREMGGAE